MNVAFRPPIRPFYFRSQGASHQYVISARTEDKAREAAVVMGAPKTILNAEEWSVFDPVDDERRRESQRRLGVEMRSCENGGWVVIVPTGKEAEYPWFHYYDGEEDARRFMDREIDRMVTA